MKDDYNCEENSKFEVILDDILFKKLKRDKGKKGRDTQTVTEEREGQQVTQVTLNVYKYFLALARTRLSKTLLRIIL
jgi:hypothetical protein